MTNANLQKLFLIVSAIGLTPIALSYGIIPSKSLSYFYEIEGSDINIFHVFRAVMGLYLALICFWFLGASKPQYTNAAMYSAVVFMLGLFAGRILSLIMDGIPSMLFLFYTGLELVCGTIGLLLLRNPDKN